jgi:hypothetical protein
VAIIVERAVDHTSDLCVTETEVDPAAHVEHEGKGASVAVDVLGGKLNEEVVQLLVLVLLMSSAVTLLVKVSASRAMLAVVVSAVMVCAPRLCFLCSVVTIHPGVCGVKGFSGQFDELVKLVLGACNSKTPTLCEGGCLA